MKKKKGKLRKAWDGSKVIYNVASWGATAIGCVLYLISSQILVYYFLHCSFDNSRPPYSFIYIQLLTSAINSLSLSRSLDLDVIVVNVCSFQDLSEPSTSEGCLKCLLDILSCYIKASLICMICLKTSLISSFHACPANAV